MYAKGGGAVNSRLLPMGFGDRMTTVMKAVDAFRVTIGFREL
jgi:hypothetical protein